VNFRATARSPGVVSQCGDSRGLTQVQVRLIDGVILRPLDLVLTPFLEGVGEVPLGDVRAPGGFEHFL